MGMTIDESMKVLQEVPKVMAITKEAIDVATNTMHKYQKIEKIIKNAGIFAFDVPEIRRIAEVMKDE